MKGFLIQYWRPVQIRYWVTPVVMENLELFVSTYFTIHKTIHCGKAEVIAYIHFLTKILKKDIFSIFSLFIIRFILGQNHSSKNFHILAHNACILDDHFYDLLSKFKKFFWTDQGKQMLCIKIRMILHVLCYIRKKREIENIQYCDRLLETYKFYDL